MNTMFLKIEIPEATNTTVLDLNVLHVNYGCTSFFSYDQEWARENNMLEVLFEEMNHELFHPKRPAHVVLECKKPTKGSIVDFHMICLFHACLRAFKTYSALTDFMHRVIFQTAPTFNIYEHTSGNNMCNVYKNILARFRREATVYTPQLTETNYPMWDAMQLILSRTAALDVRGLLKEAEHLKFQQVLKTVFPSVKNTNCSRVEQLWEHIVSLYANCMQSSYIHSLEPER